MKFSERYGYSPTKDIQIKNINTNLKNSLWNQIITYVLNPSQPPGFRQKANNIYLFIKNGIWGDHLKIPIDDFSTFHYIADLREIYNSLIWYKIYDLLEYIVKNHPSERLKKIFIQECNRILKREISGYRFIDEIISIITSEEEIANVEEAMKDEDPFKPVSIHIKNALKLFTDRKAPDYRNSIKESISAVESICNIITGEKKSTLGQALKEVEKKIPIHKALKSAFQNLYGYTSDAEGIRHALMVESDLDHEDAKFMLISCSAFVNYLKEKIKKSIET